MKGIRFYQENGKRSVVAVLVPQSEIEREFFVSTGMHEALGGVFDRDNSPVATTSVSVDYLREKCKRISEKMAREIHPELFKHPAMMED
jgi:hypothetical protein